MVNNWCEYVNYVVSCYPICVRLATGPRSQLAMQLSTDSVCLKDDGTGDGTLHGKISVSELHFFLNIRTVLHRIIINKRINYLISDGKSSINHSNNMYYFHSRSANDSQFSQ